ncbi:MAG: pyridoxamine 5'-phosphate oxidase family protein [Thermosynechococcaceae cyanobacterium]
MAESGWNRQESPFHLGEQGIQTRLGIRDKMERIGRRVIRDYMPDQHRQFYQALSFLLLGTTDEQGRPWASIVVDRPGFITSPDPRRLNLLTQPLYGSPLQDTLEVGAEVGVLGILLVSRRRNRLTGRFADIRPDGFAIAIDQSFGNCPQYIQTRSVELVPDHLDLTQERLVYRSDRFDEPAQALITNADTFFIATSYCEDPAAASQGADVSHRGGKPGFVKLEDHTSFIFPDFSGNLIFNTIGNLSLNPKSGYLFIDFEQGDLLYMTGTSDIIWDGAIVDNFAGAERMIRFRAESVIRVEKSLPLRFTFGAYSPTLEGTGSWT